MMVGVGKYVSMISSHFFRSQQKLVLVEGLLVQLQLTKPKTRCINLVVVSIRVRARGDMRTKAQQGGPLQPDSQILQPFQ